MSQLATMVQPSVPIASNSMQKRIINRRVEAHAVVDSATSANQRRIITAMTQQGTSSSFSNTPSVNNFINAKTVVAYAFPTELSNKEILLKVRSAGKYFQPNTCRIVLTVKLQKKVNNAWINVPDADKLIVTPGAVANMLREKLKVTAVHPGETEDHVRS